MTSEELQLLAGLKRVCAEAPAFALRFPDNGLTVVDELEFGCRLVDIAQGILRHARERGLAVHDERARAAIGQRPARRDLIIDGSSGQLACLRPEV